MVEKLKQTEVWFKLLLLVGFIYFYFAAVDYPERAKQYPQLIASVTLILIVISLLNDFTQRSKTGLMIGGAGDTDLKALEHESRILKRRRFSKAWAIVFFSICVGFLGGFLFSTFFFFFGFTLVFGAKKNFIRNMVVGIGMTIATYVVFDYLMGVPLLEGILWDML